MFLFHAHVSGCM